MYVFSLLGILGRVSGYDTEGVRQEGGDLASVVGARIVVEHHGVDTGMPREVPSPADISADEVKR